ncbi:MAG TPA: TonB-dependent receptor [Longimicrobiaceae bacterium]|nr:TonB-dependent receptor [Longimicrobiaceae bacterium]
MQWKTSLACLLALCLLPVGAAAQATGSISGTVTNGATGEPLAGASVTIPTTKIGALTGANGQFTLTGVAPGSYTVRAAYLGYSAQEQTVTVTAGQTATVNFGLSAQAVQLEGIVAIGYGTTQKKDLTGAVSTVKPEQLAKVPTNRVEEALQGKVPGLDITRNGGSPNSGVSIKLRGTRSLTASNSPLVIVDGNQFGNLEDLNANDIQSIQVLKDASSTAIYGSRGANGVIIVTTKDGAHSGTNVTVNAYVGMTQVTSYPRINTGPEFIAQKREAFRATGQWSSPADDPNIFTPEELQHIQDGTYTDFRDLLFHTGYAQNYQVGVTTSTDNTRAYLSASLYDEQGILKLDNQRRYTLRLNLDRDLGGQWKVGTNSQVTYYDSNTRRDPFNLANKINPLTFAFDSTGALIPRPNNGKDMNPLADEQPNVYKDNTLTTRVLPSLYAEWAPVSGLTLRSTLAADLLNDREGNFRASNTIDRDGQAPLASYETNNHRNLSWENVLTYKHDFGNNSLGLTGITSYLNSKQDFVTASGQNQLLASQLFYGLGNAPEGVAISSGYVGSGLMSYAGRVNYGYLDRYLLTLTGREDCSSRLSAGNQCAFFPSVAGAWRISDEAFMAGQSLFSDLKLRASWGISGNDAVDPYSTQAVLTKIPFSFGEDPAAGYTFSSQLGNPNLKWETSATADLGLDFGLWNNRVAGSLDVYRTNTSNLLLQRFLPPSSGASSVLQNVGKTRNEGIELSLSTINVETPDLSWNSDFTFATNKEQIVQLVGDQNDVGNGWFIGYPANVFYDYQKLGIWQDSASAAAWGQKPGEIMVKDQNGDGKITSDDRTILGAANPKWSGSMVNSLRYKDFDLSATVFARIGQMMDYDYYEDYKPGGVENGAHVDYWTPENPSNAFPRPNAKLSKSNYPYFSSLYYADGSFVKLSNVTVGYTLPSSLSGRLHSDRVRIYLTGKSLAWWSKVDNYDPERGGSLTSPMTRLFVAGVDVGF